MPKKIPIRHLPISVPFLPWPFPSASPEIGTAAVGSLSVRFFFRSFPCLLFILLPLLGSGQKSYSLVPVSSENVPASLASMLSVKQFPSSLERTNHLRSIVPTLYEKGFLAASIDKQWEVADTLFYWVYIGKQYRWANLSVREKDLVNLGIPTSPGLLAKGETISPTKLKILQKSLLGKALNAGYPVASIALDSLCEKDGNVDAKLAISLGARFVLLEIRNRGGAKVSENYLYKTLGLRKGMVYDARTLNKIDGTLANIPFLKQSAPWKMQLYGNTFSIDFFLEPQASNEVDALIGYQPADQQTTYSKSTVTGNGRLTLTNIFGQGEGLYLDWQQLQPQSPKLAVSYQAPYVLGLNQGIETGFRLFKRDSAFLNLSARVGVKFVSSLRRNGTVAYQTEATNLLTIDTLEVRYSKRLPDVADTRTNSFTLGYTENATDYLPCPTNGWDWGFSISVGTKKIKKNQTIAKLSGDGFNYGTLYDTLQTTSYVVSARASMAKYWFLGRSIVLKAGINAGSIWTQRYYRNEMFLLGGAKLLRGFDEESIIAGTYSVGTGELRCLIGPASYFFSFADLAASHNPVNGKSNGFQSTGFGLAYRTKRGIMNLTYALGKRDDLGFDPRQARVHIGFASMF